MTFTSFYNFNKAGTFYLIKFAFFVFLQFDIFFFFFEIGLHALSVKSNITISETKKIRSHLKINLATGIQLMIQLRYSTLTTIESTSNFLLIIHPTNNPTSSSFNQCSLNYCFFNYHFLNYCSLYCILSTHWYSIMLIMKYMSSGLHRCNMVLLKIVT